MADACLTDEDYEMLASFRFALRKFIAFSEAAARRDGLTPRQHQALLGIRAMQGQGAASVSDLAAFLILQHNSTVELVDRLVAAGFVARATDPEDGRRVRLALTGSGEARLAALSQTHLDELEQIGPELRRLLARIQRYRRRVRGATRCGDAGG
ncbi:MarR family winged helix-turn-helix transcriptional regulator [Acidiphilium sp.]|uniref:MarR family winged helix-turn-helix transcriptional regulator n=1 Tax=Acidiphilium sp. TaxID=527 RepID=UPI00258A5E01|nr:MarR family transcriptional regulator [Acidiphilium sp.]